MLVHIDDEEHFFSRNKRLNFITVSYTQADPATAVLYSIPLFVLCGECQYQIMLFNFCPNQKFSKQKSIAYAMGCDVASRCSCGMHTHC